MLSLQHFRLQQGMNWYEERISGQPSAILAVITYGTCMYWINGEKVVAHKGGFVWIPPGADYYGKSVPTVFHEQFQLEIAPQQQISSLGDSIFAQNNGLYSRLGSYEMILDRLRVLRREWEEQIPFARERVAALALDIIALWSRELQRGQLSAQSLSHVERMKAYIQEHYRGKITKDHLGHCIGRSPNHAAWLFRKATGVTISEYAHNVRVRTAQYMLKESLLTVSEISDYLGYSDVTYFQRVFKRSTGHPPSYYLNDRRHQV